MIRDSREKRPDPFLSNTPRKPFYVQNCKFGI
jgi:hypothetical protein